MILIGSKAIKHHFPDFPREPKDIDYAVSSRVSEEDRALAKRMLKVEYLYNPILINDGTGIASANQLCTLKASHLCWNIQWDKHMFDLQFLLKKGCTIDHELFFKLYKFWNEFNSKNKRSDLRMSKEDFFTNGINYDTLEHDEVHKIINPVPVYTKILKDGEEVELDENKW